MSRQPACQPLLQGRGDHAETSRPRHGKRFVKDWTETFGTAESAHAQGVTGRLAEVNDGTYSYVKSTLGDDASAMLDRFVTTADYEGPVTLHGRIVDEDGEEIDSASLRWQPRWMQSASED